VALRTMGTTTTSILDALRFGADVTPQDFGNLSNLIKDDKVGIAGAHLRLNNAFSQNGLLYVPNRGVLQVLPGDYVAVDSDGWPILVSASSIGYASTEWAHS
jgi:hypothetical protein